MCEVGEEGRGRGQSQAGRRPKANLKERVDME